jgi:hypothetical protein
MTQLIHQYENLKAMRRNAVDLLAAIDALLLLARQSNAPGAALLLFGGQVFQMCEVIEHRLGGFVETVSPPAGGKMLQ